MPNLAEPPLPSDPVAHHGVVVAPPAKLGDPFTVRVPDFDELHVFEIRRWEDRGGQLPVEGDRVLVIIDDEAEPWAAAWWPTEGVAKGLTEGIFFAINFGLAAAKSSAVNKVAIDKALAAADSAGGGEVVLPSTFDFSTDGGHVIPTGVDVRSRGRQTKIYNRGATFCFQIMELGENPTNPERRSGGLRNVAIYGSSEKEGLAAVKGGIGVECSNGQRHRLYDVMIRGFTGENSIGLRFYNRGANGFTEQVLGLGVTIENCTVLVEFKKDAEANDSFGYNSLRHLQLQTFADQTAIKVAGGSLYNCKIDATFHYTGNNGVGIEVAAGAVLGMGTHIHVVGEMLGEYTGCKRILNKGFIACEGRFFVVGNGAVGQPPDENSGTGMQFIEPPLPRNALEGAKIAETIASAAEIAFPTGTDVFLLTGSTKVTTAKVTTGTWPGRRVTLIMEKETEFGNAGTIRLRTGAATKFPANTTLNLIYRNGVFYEV